MFRSFFGIEENPFSNTPDPRYFFKSRRHVEALAHLMYGVQGGSGFVLLTGEVGTGKTTVCRALMDQLPDNVDLALCMNPRLSEAELLATICDELGLAYSGLSGSVKAPLDVLNRHLLDGHARGRRTALIIDEAQNLSPRVLEQVRLLTNLETASTKLLQIILVGQPELKPILESEDLRQLNQRITARYHLDAMHFEEARAFIHHRLRVSGLSTDVFGSAAIAEIFDRSNGIPRLIVTICERCLLGAYAVGKKHVDGKLARAAAKEVLGKASRTRRRGRKLVTATVGAVVLAVAALSFIAFDPLRLGLAAKFPQPWSMTTIRQMIQSWPPAAIGLGEIEGDNGQMRPQQNATTKDGAEPPAPGDGTEPSVGPGTGD